MSVREMSAEDRRQTGYDPEEEAVLNTILHGRHLTILRAYQLKYLVDRQPTADAREELFERLAYRGGRSKRLLMDEYRVAEVIKEADLRDAFAKKGIAPEDWLMRLDMGHLIILSKATNQKTFRVISSTTAAEIAAEAYHGNWSAEELREELRRRGMAAPEVARLAPPIKKTGLKASDFLRWLAGELERTGLDFDVAELLTRRGSDVTISRELPWWIHRLAELWESVGPKKIMFKFKP